jgi:hypothetical protein
MDGSEAAVDGGVSGCNMLDCEKNFASNTKDAFGAKRPASSQEPNFS